MAAVDLSSMLAQSMQKVAARSSSPPSPRCPRRLPRNRPRRSRSSTTPPGPCGTARPPASRRSPRRRTGSCGSAPAPACFASMGCGSSSSSRRAGPDHAVRQRFGAPRDAGQRPLGRLSLRRREPDSQRHHPELWRAATACRAAAVLSIVEDSDGHDLGRNHRARWPGSRNGRWHTRRPRRGASRRAPSTAMLVDRQRRLWVSAEAGVFMRATGATRFERVGPPLHSAGGSRIYSFLQEAPDGAIWGSSQDRGLRQLAPAARRPRGSGAAARPRNRWPS